MDMTYKCPRCGTGLERSLTSARKVCFDCPACGGRQITIPVLREVLGNAGVAALTRVAHESKDVGCVCPGCGRQMRLAKVEIDGRKVLIDICGTCLSVWCDRGEFEALVPETDAPVRAESMAEIARRASMEARENLAKSMLGSLPENAGAEDMDVVESLKDVVRLVAGMPNFWRTIRPVTPLFSVLLLLAIPVMQSVIYFASRGTNGAVGGLYRGGRDFACFDAGMAVFGYAMTSFKTCFSFPFLQGSGFLSILLAFLLSPLFIVIERRSGHMTFLLLLALSWLGAILSHSVMLLLGVSTGTLCGISPVVSGFAGFAVAAWSDASVSLELPSSPWKRGTFDLTSFSLPFDVYAAGVALGCLLIGVMGIATVETATIGLWANVFCAIVCSCLGLTLKRRRIARAP